MKFWYKKQLLKVQEHVYGLKKLDFKTQGATKFITLRPLVVPGCRTRVAPSLCSGYKFHRSLCFEVSLLYSALLIRDMHVTPTLHTYYDHAFYHLTLYNVYVLVIG